MVWGEQGNNENEEKNPGTKKNKSPWGDDNQNIEDLIKESQKKIKDFLNKNGPNNHGFGGGSNTPSFPLNFLYFFAALLLLIWLASGFYIIEEDEQAVVLQFGKFSRVANPGPNYHLPYPIEEIIKHKVTIHQVEEFGYRSAQTDMVRMRRADIRNIPEESLMLTGDENIVDINFMVRWKIDDIKDYVLNLQNPRETVKMAAESAVREIIGKTPFVEAQTLGRSKLETESMKLLQEILDSYKSGISIVNLQMLKVDPPQQVIDAFRDVQTARADKEREINQAYAYSNDLLPRARGEAKKIIQDALAYKHEVIARAQGEASRFKAILDEYKKAKDVVKQKIYIETMEAVYKNLDKVIIDPSAKTLMPYLPLDKVKNAN